MVADHNIKAVFFDLDGVLVDAADWHRDALNSALKKHCGFALAQPEHMTFFNGLSTRRKLAMLIEQRRVPDDSRIVDSIHEYKQKETIRIIKETCKVAPSRIFEAIKGAKTLGPVAVVTNCSRPTAELMLNLSGIHDLFDAVFTNEDFDGQIKPKPFPYMLACSHFSVEPFQAFVIDDTYKGIQSAIDARCRFWHMDNFEDLSWENLSDQIERLRVTI